MGIKPDHWIRRMALEHRMIDPFVESSVRAGVVSYGLSSYGYDIRVSNEFKIFTNVNSAIVDPKNFDPSSFVDFTGDVCIIPPNSFVLSRTVEHFRIPREVLTICVGKCVAGDTRVVDAETGAYRPISEFAGCSSTLALDRWRTTQARVSAFVPQGKKPVYEVTTRLGLKIRATAQHPFRRITEWTPLNQLRPGDRIAVARHIPVFGRAPLPRWEAALLGLAISEGQAVEARVPQRVFTAPREDARAFLQALFSGGGSIRAGDGSIHLEHDAMSRRLAEDVHHLLLRFGIVSRIRETRTPQGKTSCRIQITDLEHTSRFAREIGFWPGSTKQRQLEAAAAPFLADPPRHASHFDTPPVDAMPLARGAPAMPGGSMRSPGAEEVSLKQPGSMPSASRLAAAAPADEHAELAGAGPLWDTIETIEYRGEEEVFDLTVPLYHSFIANDIHVHNSTYARCGLLCNVTPLEPEWAGYLTLEISNTTPLPAKVYANEGIAQLIFLGGDGVCEQSYADKKGKYQGQTGVVLPKIER